MCIKKQTWQQTPAKNVYRPPLSMHRIPYKENRAEIDVFRPVFIKSL